MKFRVKVTEKRSVSAVVEIEADSLDAAYDKAYSEVELPANGNDAYREVQILEQTAGPWVYLKGNETGYYLDHQKSNRNVVVFETPKGHVFDAGQVGILQHRLESLGFKVRDSWNGAGHGSVSFSISNRVGKTPMTEAMKAYLVADIGLPAVIDASS